MSFSLDPNIERDTWFVCDLTLSSVRLHRNATWPWIILIPRRENVFDLIDLSEADQGTLLREVNKVAHTLRRLSTPDKLNIASIGNITRQLHIHIIARRVGDAGWPHPVWGQPFNAQYGARQHEELIKLIYDELHH